MREESAPRSPAFRHRPATFPGIGHPTHAVCSKTRAHIRCRAMAISHPGECKPSSSTFIPVHSGSIVIGLLDFVSFIPRIRLLSSPAFLDTGEGRSSPLHAKRRARALRLPDNACVNTACCAASAGTEAHIGPRRWHYEGRGSVRDTAFHHRHHYQLVPVGGVPACRPAYCDWVRSPSFFLRLKRPALG